MATETIDARGLSCPQPILKVAAKAPAMNAGDLLVVKADCSTFPDDIKQWCGKTGKVLVSCNTSGDEHEAQVKF
ncbi:MAG: sulfurtransferase TusA family protein [bacterium]